MIPARGVQKSEIFRNYDVICTSSFIHNLFIVIEENPYSFAFKAIFVITSFCFLVYGFRSDYAGHSVETGELKECTEFPLIFKSMFVVNLFLPRMRIFS